jgi:hypothetical protein
MALIDRTYFIGELNIPNQDRTDVQERLDWFIEKYESELLLDLFGYQLYKAFNSGLTGSPLESIWSNLLYGAEYTNSNARLDKWRGMLNLPGSLINAIDAANTITVIVNGGGTYDPVAGLDEVALPASLVGKDFIIEKRGVGQLRSDEYEVTVGNTIRLLGGSLFVNADTYFYKSATLALNTSTGAVKKSFIANYIYFHFMRDNDTQTTGVGEVKNKSENAATISPALKMCRAWNEMSDWIGEMFNYLEVNRGSYPGWTDQYKWGLRNKYRHTNIYGV